MTALLEARGLSRGFGHVRALDAADFDIGAGEVVGLIGDNGAGKSTLIKALSGSLEARLRADPRRGPGGAPRVAAAGERARHRGRLPGSRAGAAPEPDAERLPRPRDPGEGRAGPARLHGREGDAQAGGRLVQGASAPPSARSPRPWGRCRVVSGRASPSPGRSPGPARSSSWTSRRPHWAWCRPRTSSSRSSGCATRASPWCSSATRCRTSSTCATASRCCGSGTASPPTTRRTRPSRPWWVP
nr:ATP-binding cassette domain-containing protein [Angustibacter aerolatus]